MATSAEDMMFDEDAIEAVEQCDRILEMCENIPERGEDFAATVLEKVGDIREWIVNHDHVTEKQLSALENFESGVGRWID